MLSSILRWSSFLGNSHFSSCFLKSSIFLIQQATALENGVEFHQGAIGVIRSFLALSYDRDLDIMSIAAFCEVMVKIKYILLRYSKNRLGANFALN